MSYQLSHMKSAAATGNQLTSALLKRYEETKTVLKRITTE